MSQAVLAESSYTCRLRQRLYCMLGPGLAAYRIATVALFSAWVGVRAVALDSAPRRLRRVAQAARHRPAHRTPGGAVTPPAPALERAGQGGQRPLGTPKRGKEVKIQGVSVRATRNPSLLIRNPEELPKRPAERRNHGSRYQEPPRNTRRPQSPLRHALPSEGAPA